MVTACGRMSDHTQTAVSPEHSKPDPKLLEVPDSGQGRSGSGLIEHHPGAIRAERKVVGLLKRVAPLAELQLNGSDVRRHRPPPPGCLSRVIGQFHDA
jgi:hypothetical protein